MPDIFTSDEPSKKINEPVSHLINPPASHLKKHNFEAEMEGQIIHPRGNDIHHTEGHSHNVLSSYCLYPDHAKFINTDTQEKIVLLLRKHPITNIPWVLATLLMIIAPSFTPFLPFLDKLPPGYEVMLILCWYLITFAFALEKFLNWFFNVNLITDERIFDVDFVNLMYREITEADIDQIEDVTVKIGGGIRTLFGYGDVFVQTAAETERIEFLGVPYPDRVAKVLRELGVEEEIEKIEGRIR